MADSGTAGPAHRVRIHVTLTVEFDLDPTAYPDGASPEAMLEIDLQNFAEDPEDLFSFDNLQVSARGEVLA